MGAMANTTAEVSAPVRGVVFELQTVTTMFMHGAGGIEHAELRSPPFKAAARYWFRAAVGDAASLKCSDPGGVAGACACLRCLEGRVFGSTTAGKGVVFHVPCVKQPRAVDDFLLPHHPRNGKGLDGPAPAKGIGAKTAFELRLIASRPGPEVAAAASAFWLAAHLGGFGQRSRRGAGSVLVDSIRASAGTVLPEPIGRPADVQALARALEAGIAMARSCARPFQQPAGAPAGTPPFPMLRPASSHTVVQVVPLAAKIEQDARREVMRSLQRFKNPVFGLPYMKPASGDPRDQIRGRDVRHASPLWIHIHPLEGGGFAAVQTVMRSASVTGHPKMRKVADWRKVDDYLASFPSAVRVAVR